MVYVYVRTTTVADAVASARALRRDWWDRMAQDVFGVRGEILSEETVIEKIKETNTFTDLSSVEAWIDPEGWYRLKVWDPSAAGVRRSANEGR